MKTKTFKILFSFQKNEMKSLVKQMNHWNFDEPKPDEYDVNVQDVIQRVREKRNISNKNKPISTSVDPPTKVLQSLPESHPTQTCGSKHPSVIRFLVESMKNKCLKTVIAVPKQGTTLESEEPIKRDTFDEIDEETEAKLNKKYFEKEPESRIVMIEEDINFDRPSSPGKDHDKEYISCEIGVQKPRFKADVHELIYGKQMGIDNGKLIKISAGARKVEQDLKDQYRKNSDIDTAQKTTTDTLQERYKNKQKVRRLKRKGLYVPSKLDLSSV
jgi:hypothetical protein